MIKSIHDLKPYREQILDIANQYGVTNIRVFGSVARGEANPQSDVDFLVEFTAHSLINRIQFMQSLSDLLSCKVDVVQEKSLRSFAKEQALAEAVDL